MPIRIFIIDHIEVMRAGIRLICSRGDDIVVVGESSRLASSLSELADLRPDVIVFDVDQVTEQTLRDIHQAKCDLPESQLLAYTSHDCPEVAQAILHAGAAGFLVKAGRTDEIIVAIRSLYEGRIYISHSPRKANRPHSFPHFPVSSLTSRSNRLGYSSPGLGGHGNVDIVREQTVGQRTADLLSPREREVLLLLADGLTNKQIAQQLFLSIKTIETYRSRLMRKYGLCDRAGIIRLAREFSPTEKTLHQHATIPDL